MVGNLWERTKTFFSRVLRREPLAPGRFESGSRSSWRGFVLVAPWIWPKRDYLVYVPRGHARWRRTTLLVLIHGCHQTAQDIAAGTRVTQLADELSCLVLLPCQEPRANAWGCWNWFDRRTAAGAGEAAIVAAQIRAVRRQYRVHRKRVFVAGMSSGAGLATALALRHSALFAGVFVHSGIAAGAASSPLTAVSVLQRGPDTDVAAIALATHKAAGTRARVVPILVVHGTLDATVVPVHASEVIRQFLAFAGHPGVAAFPAALPSPQRELTAELAGERRTTTSEWRHDGRLEARRVLVEGLAHAWSGGDAQWPYNDAMPPDATALWRAFMNDVLHH
ncbi:MAG: PHB depolymerase family esterase [Betaproteobacteria bacterium]